MRMVPAMTTRIHLARPGQYRDMHDRAVDLDAQRIRDLASNYNAGTWRAPLVLGHPAHDAQAHGWVTKLEVAEDGELWGEVGQVSTALSDWVREGRYKNVSISWWPKGHANNPASDTDTLRHVGVLGAQPPAIAGLEPLSFSDDEKGVVTVEMPDVPELGDSDWAGWWGTKGFMRGVRDFLIGEFGLDRIDKALPAHLIDSVDSAADAAMRDEPSFSDPNPESPMTTNTPGANPDTGAADPTDLADREARLVEREARIAVREQEAAAAETAAIKDRAVSFCDGLVKEGKLAPAGREIVEHIHATLAGGNEPISFSDGATRPPLAEFEKLLGGAHPIVNLSEMTKGDAQTFVPVGDPVALADRAEEIRKAHPRLSPSEAVRQAEAEAQEGAA